MLRGGMVAWIFHLGWDHLDILGALGTLKSRSCCHETHVIAGTEGNRSLLANESNCVYAMTSGAI